MFFSYQLLHTGMVIIAINTLEWWSLSIPYSDEHYQYIYADDRYQYIYADDSYQYIYAMITINTSSYDHYQYIYAMIERNTSRMTS